MIPSSDQNAPSSFRGRALEKCRSWPPKSLLHPHYAFHYDPAKLSNLQNSKLATAQNLPDNPSAESSASIVCQIIRHCHPWVNSAPSWTLSILLPMYIERQAPRFSEKYGGNSVPVGQQFRCENTAYYILGPWMTKTVNIILN